MKMVLKKASLFCIVVTATGILMPAMAFAEGGDIAVYKKFIDFQWSIIGTLVVVLVGILVFIFKNVLGDIRELRKTIENMNNRINSKFENINSKFENINSRFENINSRLEKINVRLAGIEAVMPMLKKKALGMSGSPMRLTEEGEKVLNSSGCRQYLEDNKEDLLRQFDDIKTPFDVEEKAKDIIRSSRKDMDRYIDKDFMHDDGKSFDDVVFVLGIELRDMVLHAREESSQHSD